MTDTHFYVSVISSKYIPEHYASTKFLPCTLEVSLEIWQIHYISVNIFSVEVLQYLMYTQIINWKYSNNNLPENSTQFDILGCQIFGVFFYILLYAEVLRVIRRTDFFFTLLKSVYDSLSTLSFCQLSILLIRCTLRQTSNHNFLILFHTAHETVVHLEHLLVGTSTSYVY